MSPRERPPNRRGGETFLVERLELSGGVHRFWVTVGLAGGAVREMFVQAEKTASPIEALARDGAILTSFALQHGAGVAELAAAITREDGGRPSTVLGAILDAVAAAYPASPPYDPGYATRLLLDDWERP